MRLLSGLGMRELARRVFAAVKRDQVLARAAELAYFFLLAIFPLLVFITSLVGIAAGADTRLHDALLDYLARLMPESAYDVVRSVLDETTSASSGLKAFAGLGLALLSASKGMGAVIRVLNEVFHRPERRSFLRARGVAIGLTLAMGGLMLLAAASVVFGGPIAHGIEGRLRGGSFLVPLWNVLQWPIAIVCVVACFALIYRYGPERERPARWLTPGALAGVALWLAGSIALRTYVAHFSDYSATYGSLGAVIALMLWFYFTGVALLVGAEVDSELEPARPRARALVAVP